VCGVAWEWREVVIGARKEQHYFVQLWAWCVTVALGNRCVIEVALEDIC